MLNSRIIVLLCLTSSLGRFVLDSYLPSLPAIGQDFNLTAASTELTLTLYLLGFSLSQLIYGPLSDTFGRRIIMIGGLFIFIIGSLICAFAQSPNMLLIARLITGAGAGSCGVLNRAIASDCFQGPELSKAWSHTTTTLVVTLCVAPILGGYVQEWYGWRANFELAAFYVGLVMMAIIKYLPETNEQKINQTSSSLQLKKILKNYLDILSTRSFITGTACYTLTFSGLIAYFQVSPNLFINVFGLTPSQYGWCSLVIAINYLIGGVLVRHFVHRVGSKNLLLIGTLFLISGGISMLVAYMLNFAGIIAILFPAAVYVLGARIIIPNAIAESMGEVRHLSGSSSALIGCLQMLGSSLISLWISKFSHTSSLILALFLTILGCIALAVTCLIKKSHLASVDQK